MTSAASGNTSTASQVRSGGEAEVVDLCRDLLRIESVNRGPGDGDERKAAEYVAAKLEEVGLETTIVESEKNRTSVVARMEGEDRSRGGLLIHGHLDVVPADASDWTLPPFAGEIGDDGCLWGRGAVDMKDMDAMTLALVRDRMRTGRKPPRDVVLAFVADEEAGGRLGARYLVENHADLFEGCTEAISEVGGFSYEVSNDLRLYLIETAQKGIGWMKLTVAGRAGHGSMLAGDNAVTELAEAVGRLGRYTFPVQLRPSVRHFLEELSEATGWEFDPEDPKATIDKLGALARLVGATISHTANPTQLQAGAKVNVIPNTATAYVDGRFLPGGEDDFEKRLDDILGPRVEREWLWHDQALETTFDGELVDTMAASLKAEDPGARAVPYMLSGGTDAKSFSRLGIRCFGFAPLKLPGELDFAAMFHGVDERVPTEALQFGVRVLDRFLDGC
ncbi:MAG TPA: M20/M25/M40 family metallo-hydrolase [Frankiaceae bacterium]|nr:M20/M25/M40 family metallo-hydrolase [Frankiaceae bacterium]